MRSIFITERYKSTHDIWGYSTIAPRYYHVVTAISDVVYLAATKKTLWDLRNRDAIYFPLLSYQ